MNIIKVITIDPGHSGAIAKWNVVEGKLQLISVGPVNVIKGPHLWPTQAVAKEEERILKAISDGTIVTPTKSKDVLKDRKKAFRPEPTKRLSMHFFTEPQFEDDYTLVVCEKPALGQAGKTTAASIASTAASEMALTCVALTHGHPVLLVAPAQWQGEMLPDDKRDSKIRAAEAIRKKFPDLLKACSTNKKGIPHDGEVDALLLGMWVEQHITTISQKLDNPEGEFRYPFPKDQTPKLYGL